MGWKPMPLRFAPFRLFDSWRLHRTEPAHSSLRRPATMPFLPPSLRTCLPPIPSRSAASAPLATAAAALLSLLSLLAPLIPISASAIDFVEEVRPILEAHCYECHGPEMQRSGLRLDVKAAALRGGEFHAPTLAPGDPEGSALLRFVRGDDPEMRMPPKGEALAAAEIAVLEAWIAAGAPWPDGVDAVELADPLAHWSFQPVARPEPPTVGGSAWARGEIDRFILQGLEKAGLAPSPQASPLVWLRRVHFDLVGLPPTPEEVRDFLERAEGGSESAYAEVVERLLDSPRYGERWAQHWLDVVRYADTHGFEVNTPRPNAWPYRDYVIAAFNDGTPYDRFVMEQLAGDQLGRDAATGFLVTAAALLPGQIGKDEASMRLARQDELGEIVTNVGEGLLGLTMSCARCHHHKFDPVTAQDYYSLQAFFAGVDYGERRMDDPAAETEAAALRDELAPVERELTALLPVARPTGSSTSEGETPLRPAVNARLNQDRFAPVTASALRFTILETNNREPCLDELEVFDLDGVNLALASQGTKASFSGSRVSRDRHEERFLNDGLYGNARSWMSDEVGGGWVRLDFAGRPVLERVAWGRDREGKFRDRLAIRYRIEVLDVAGEWRLVADHSDRSPREDGAEPAGAAEIDLESLAAEERERAERVLRRRDGLTGRLQAYPDGGRLVFAGAFRKPEPMPWLRRGDPEQPQEEVPPATPAFLGGPILDPAAPDPERRLALARWIADPANPLTARVMANRVWLWHFGNGLVESANDFGHAGTPPSHPQLLDWLADEFVRSGWSLKRLHRLVVLSSTYRQASYVNEAGQAADAGVRLLWRYPSRRAEAEAIRDSVLAVSGRLEPVEPGGGGPGFDLFRQRGGLSGFVPVESFGAEGRRRLVYAHKIRMEQDAVFGAFDCPDAGQSMPRRTRSTTPLQALNLFNSVFTLEEAEALAERVREEVASGNGDAGDGVGDPTEAEVRRAWLLALGREPDAEELADATAVVREHGLATLCRALYNSSEFLFIP